MEWFEIIIYFAHEPAIWEGLGGTSSFSSMQCQLGRLHWDWVTLFHHGSLTQVASMQDCGFSPWRPLCGVALSSSQHGSWALRSSILRERKWRWQSLKPGPRNWHSLTSAVFYRSSSHRIQNIFICLCLLMVRGSKNFGTIFLNCHPGKLVRGEDRIQTWPAWILVYPASEQPSGSSLSSTCWLNSFLGRWSVF